MARSMQTVVAVMMRAMAFAAIIAAASQFTPRRVHAQTGVNPCGACSAATLSWDCPAVTCNKTCVLQGGVPTCF